MTGRGSCTSSTFPTIAVVGAGPGLGRAIARRFGAAGHPVALVSRDAGKLQSIADSLTAEGVTARVHPADITDVTDDTDNKALTGALEAAVADLGRIGVLAPHLPERGRTGARPQGAGNHPGRRDHPGLRAPHVRHVRRRRSDRRPPRSCRRCVRHVTAPCR
ncbi:SDR family NAD(P)-dependent oxidoreductase [Streptomyces sp. YKOK-I1]